MSTTLSPKNTKLVWGKSGNRCAMCKNLLTLHVGDSHHILGIMAHNEGEKPGSARYRADMTDLQRNSYPNLLLLCGGCHDKIDKDRDTYTVAVVNKLKVDHERYIEEQTKVHVLAITFAELQVVLNFLVEGMHGVKEGTLQVVPPQDKIKRNSLGQDVENLLRVGLTQQKQIDDYLNKNIDMSFAKKLRSVLIEKYEELKADDLDSDTIFYELIAFTTNGNHEFKFQAAALAVVAYYFNVCDVFESADAA